MKFASSNQELKKAAGEAAALLVGDGMTVGLGTGSTVDFLIEKLGEMVKEGLNIKGVPTSYQSKMLCFRAGIPILDSGMLDRIDLAIDGADEIDAGLNAIKGGGAAHTIEKVIACMADEFIIVADNTKFVEHLGVSFPVPVEVMQGALGLVLKRARQLGGNPKLRTGSGKDGPVITDNGNFVIDIYFSGPPDVHKLNTEIKSVPGVVETGLFLGIARKALLAGEYGVVTLTAQGGLQSSGKDVV